MDVNAGNNSNTLITPYCVAAVLPSRQSQRVAFVKHRIIKTCFVQDRRGRQRFFPHQAGRDLHLNTGDLVIGKPHSLWAAKLVSVVDLADQQNTFNISPIESLSLSYFFTIFFPGTTLPLSNLRKSSDAEIEAVVF